MDGGHMNLIPADDNYNDDSKPDSHLVHCCELHSPLDDSLHLMN